MAGWEMRMGPVGLRVKALDRLVEFYRDVVGLPVLERVDDRAILGTPTQPLLVLQAEPSIEPRSQASAGLYHTAFRVPTRAALGDALPRVEGGLTGASDHGVSEALYLRDPEGNGIELYHDRPQSEWPHEDGSLIIPTNPLNLDALRAEATENNRVPTDTDIGHVHLEVTNLQASVGFYSNTVGMRTRYSVPQAAFLAAGDYHHHLGLNTWQERTEPRTGAGLDWFSIITDENPETEMSNQHDLDDVRDPDDISIRVASSPTDVLDA